MLEMKNEWPSFEVFESNKEVLLIVYALIRCNVIWNVKLGTKNRRKARSVVG